MKITILGTGHSAALECYNTCFTIDNNHEYFLIDAGGGNGILKQLNLVNIPLTNRRLIEVYSTKWYTEKN